MALDLPGVKREGRGKLTAGEIRKKYESSNHALQREHWTFVLNRAMMFGEQWINFDRIRQTVAAIPREPDRVRATINRLWPASRFLMAKLLSRELTFEVPPSEPDDASVHGSHIAEAVLEEIIRVHKWEETREQLSWNAWLGGTSVLSLDWDQNLGRAVGQREDGSTIGTGDFFESALSILEVGWEPGTRDAETSYWWVRAQALPPSDVQKQYGLKDKPKADAGAAQGFMGRQLTAEDVGKPRPDLTLVLTYYERPSKERPKGAVATVVGDKLVDGPHPWPFPFKDRLNMVVFRETKIPSKAHGETIFTSAVPVQVAYNASWSNLIEHLKLAGNARLLVPDTALDGVEDLTDLPGELISYNASGGAPTWLTPAPLPAWVIEEPRLLAQQMDDILGVHDVSRGVAPAGIESGLGLSVLVEQDTTPLGALTREMAHGWGRFATMVLETYAKHVKDTRTARIRVKGARPEIIKWSGKDLADQTIATIPMDAIMPRSRTALLAFAKELWDRQIISDPQMFTKIADLPDQDDLLAGINADAAKAQRENRDMAIGKLVVPREFDNHGEHIRRHNEFRKTIRYESLSEEQQEQVDLHLQAHETMAAEEAGTQVRKAQTSPALAAQPTAAEAAPLPEGLVPPGAEGGTAVPAQQVPSGREGEGDLGAEADLLGLGGGGVPEAADVLGPGPEAPVIS